jgi:transcription termination factor Rho
MSVLDPKELEDSPLADLHALASELGIEGYRRLRREELVAAILSSRGPEASAGGEQAPAAADRTERPSRAERAPRPSRDATREPEAAEGRRGAEREPRDAEAADTAAEEVRTGILDVLPNGSGFVRADPFSHSGDDVYVAPAQIRRCELRTGDEVSGPVRPPRRSERYPSLVRVEKVNGADAEPPAARPEFATLTPVFARERLTAPEGLDGAPFGKGSRVAVAGPPGAGATALLRRIVATIAERHPDAEMTVVLAGARPEEVAEWRGGASVRVIGGSFDGSAERQGEAASMAVELAKRAVERGRDAVVVVDSLEFLPGPAARRVFGAARNTEEAGSLTVVAATGLATEPARHATTRIVLDPTATGEEARIDSRSSVTLRADLLG